VVGWIEETKLPAAAQDAVLRHLCEELGATELGDLKDLEPDHVEKLVRIAPPLKQKV
jgi:hypothetical protein